jgi:kynurenine formamidase
LDPLIIDLNLERVLFRVRPHLLLRISFFASDLSTEQIPPTGAKIMVMPIKIKDGTEAPIRLVAVVS